ncbi:MAG: AIR synthase family protein [Candidatus Zipacnadales bacterium]
MPKSPLPVGKLPPELLATLLSSPVTDPRVILGPGIGRDVAILEFGDRALVVKSDPVTFVAEKIGWYVVNINANDIVCAGAEPRWFLATLLLPENKTPATLVESIFAQIREACSAIGVTLIGGHTEITYGLDRPVLCGQMLGEVAKEAVVLPTGMQVGDVILMTKAIAVEGTTILAREFKESLLEAGCSLQEIEEAASMLDEPGLSVVPEARALTSAVHVHALHDPTEGGLATGLWEMAEASGFGLDISSEMVNVLPICERFCQILGLNPYGLIASGTLLAAVAPEDVDTATTACERIGVSCASIGTVTEQVGVVRWLTREGWTRLPRFDQDEIARLFAEGT